MIARQHSVPSFKGVRFRHPSSENKLIVGIREEEEESAHVQPVCCVFGSQQEVDQVELLFVIQTYYLM